MSNSSKEATKILLNALGISNEGNEMPKRWNGTPFTFPFYTKKLLDFLSKGLDSIADGTHRIMPIPIEPIQILAVPAVAAIPAVIAAPGVIGVVGVAAVDAIPAESNADFKFRRDYYMFQFKVAMDNNQDFNKKANSIVEFIEATLDNTNRNLLEGVLRGRDIPNLILAFNGLGIVLNANIGTTSMNQLISADFAGYLIQDIKAVMDFTISLSNAHREVNSKIGNEEKLTILLEKALTADSKDGEKFSHLIKDVEINRGTRTYETVFNELVNAQNLYDTKNHKSNIVDVHKLVFGKANLATPNESNNENNKIKIKDKMKCIGCKLQNHNIKDCRSYYLCQLDSTKTHHIRDVCESSKCKPPKSKLEAYLEYNKINSRKIENTNEGNKNNYEITTTKKSKRAALKVKDQENKDYAQAVKLSNDDMIESPPKRIKNDNSETNVSNEEIKSLFISFAARFDRQEENISNLQKDMMSFQRENNKNNNNRSSYSPDSHNHSRNSSRYITSEIDQRDQRDIRDSLKKLGISGTRFQDDDIDT